MDAPAKYNHISDAVFKNAWNESIHKQYNIASKQFYEVKKARMIVANIKRGRPQKHEQCYRGNEAPKQKQNERANCADTVDIDISKCSEQ